MSKAGDMYEVSRCIYIFLNEKKGNLSVKLSSIDFFEYVNIPYIYIFKILGIQDE